MCVDGVADASRRRVEGAMVLDAVVVARCRGGKKRRSVLEVRSLISVGLD